jgi:hypothetical protein
MKHDAQSASQSPHPCSVTMSICAPLSSGNTASCVRVINEPTDRTERFHGCGIIGITAAAAARSCMQLCSCTASARHSHAYFIFPVTKHLTRVFDNRQRAIYIFVLALTYSSLLSAAAAADADGDYFMMFEKQIIHNK